MEWGFVRCTIRHVRLHLKHVAALARTCAAELQRQMSTVFFLVLFVLVWSAKQQHSVAASIVWAGTVAILLVTGPGSTLLMARSVYRPLKIRPAPRHPTKRSQAHISGYPYYNWRKTGNFWTIRYAPTKEVTCWTNHTDKIAVRVGKPVWAVRHSTSGRYTLP